MVAFYFWDWCKPLKRTQQVMPDCCPVQCGLVEDDFHPLVSMVEDTYRWFRHWMTADFTVIVIVLIRESSFRTLAYLARLPSL